MRERTWIQERDELQRLDNLVWNIGDIVEQRRGDMPRWAQIKLWHYLYANRQNIYDQIGPIIDEAEQVAFTEEAS